MSDINKHYKEETCFIRIPSAKISIAEEILGRPLATEQQPTFNVRVPVSKRDEIKKAIKE